jgi:hypothetical protein
MSAEINENSKVESSSPVEAIPGEISSTQPRISEDIKKLLNSLLQKTLDKRIIRLEHRYQEQKKNIVICVFPKLENFYQILF